ncbi:MAG: tetratricopeptide repeat protein, partial [Gammaproteobacteria bacterium]|nr:tetratricopeptide repeat protein [Gammaproteobacteria bacterium]
EMTFLLAESLSDAGKLSNAIDAYEKSAYKYSEHDNSAEAGYAALLTYTALAERSDSENKKEITDRRIASALLFGQRFPNDKRAPLVLLQTAEQFFSTKQYEQATTVADGLTKHKLADSKVKTSAWTIIAHSQFATSQFDLAEKSYLSLLKLLPAQSELSRDTRELVAASIYKQGEAAINAGNQADAARQFTRLGTVIPESPKRRLAEYDAATAYIELEDWPAAIKLLENFRKRYPEEKQFKSGITEKLALAYSKNGNQSKAADEMIALSKTAADARQKELMWAAAELYESAGDSQRAISVYKNYIKAFPRPLDRAVELRHRIAEYYATRNDSKSRQYWLKEIITADANGKNQRTDRTRYLAATASMELVKPVHRRFENSKLTIPLRQSLRKKKNLMEEAISAYSKALKYQVAEVTTEATYNIAKIYNDFAKALLQSQRPTGLDEDALEEYQLLLEEQAFPFEEKAIDIHVTNFKRIPSGNYDDSVRNSLQALSKLLPFRYSRKEMSSGYIEIAQ